MDYRDLLEQVHPQWRDDFARFLDDREPSAAFEEQLDRDPTLQLLMDAAIERKVPSREGDLRRVFWEEISRVNDAVAEKLERAIENRLATPGVLRVTEAARADRPTSTETAAGVAVIEREIEELGASLQAVSSSAPTTRKELVVLTSETVSEKIGELAQAIVSLVIRRATSIR